MLLYVTVGTNNLERALEFYDPVLATLGYVRRVLKEEEIGYAAPEDERCRFWILYPYDKQEASSGNGSMTTFVAPDRSAVRAFHAAALLYGGEDEGKPGLRPYHANFYGAYIRDPDGNKLSAVCENAE
ncbi:VOC family protein [Rhizobium sp. KVB221]|uniref:VOC family protein n=1 Tax=Rhizobium setariae TaxID=2801340 RepID=A0A937CPA2_9HYPH|nr:VOC family protein [Rhizobium setariae]MBL0371572.1 VOC family protein [Rhizobium setariae]